MQFQGEIRMKVWICDECGKEVGMGSKPDKCHCGSSELIEIERADESDVKCKAPKA